jgi:toxin CptA
MLRVSVKHSRYLVAACACVHIAAITTLFPLQLPLAAKLGIALALTLSLTHSVWRFALLASPESIVGIELTDSEHGSIQFAKGAWCDGRVLPTTYVTPMLTVINMRVNGSRRVRHAIIVADNMDADDFRKLRVVLRWAYPKDAGISANVSSP